MSLQEDYWADRLDIAPKCGAIVDQNIGNFANRYHGMLRAAAGYISSNGWLSPVVRDSRIEKSVDIDSILTLVIQDLQDVGLIPKAAWYQPVAWYVLHWVVIPFVRSVLMQSHYPDAK